MKIKISKTFKMIFICVVFLLASCGFENQDSSRTEVQGNEENISNDENKKSEIKVPILIDQETLLENKNARLAIAYSIEKSYITEILLNDKAYPVDFLIPEDFAKDENGNDFRKKYPDGFVSYDEEKAKEHWAKAKEELNFEKIELEIMTYDADEAGEIAKYIAKSLTETLDGLSIKINRQSFEHKMQLVEKGKFHIDHAGWVPDYPDPLNYLEIWQSISSQNASKYYNPEFDKLIDSSKKMQASEDGTKRWEKLQEAEKILLEDAVVIPLYQPFSYGIKQDYIKGAHLNSFGAKYTYKNLSTEKKTDGKEIIYLLGTPQIPTLDQNKASDSISIEVLGNLMQGLTSIDRNGNVKPAIAESWKISEDGRKYTFKLREAKWSNGDKIVAKNFVDSWRRLADPVTTSKYQFIVETAGIKNAREIIIGEKKVEELGVRALDDMTLEVELTEPVPYFLKLLSFVNFSPIHKGFVDKLGEDFATSKETQVYSGPYVLNSLESAYGYKFRKNENYWDKKNIKNDGLDFRVVKDIQAASELFDNGEIDMLIVNAYNFEKYKDHPGLQKFKENSIYYLMLNINNHN